MKQCFSTGRVAPKHMTPAGHESAFLRSRTEEMEQTRQKKPQITRSYERYLSATGEDVDSNLCDSDGERALVSMCQSGGLIGMDRAYSHYDHGTKHMVAY